VTSFFDTFSQMLSSPEMIGWMILGTVLGVVVGAVPGLTGAMLIALTLPLTYDMSSGAALVLLVSMYVGSVSGGLITATLLRMPGTPASIMTTLDGYPMASSGRPGRALGLGITASLIGGMISWFFLLVLSKPAAVWSTKLGPFEFFSLVLMALVLIASVGGRSLSKGLLSGMLGILLAMPGTSPATGEIRLTFGFVELGDGFKLLPVLIGLFAISQVLTDILHLERRNERIEMSRDGMLMSVADLKRHWVNLLRSSLIGTWVGILPGIGANIGSVMAYTAARSVSKKADEFGRGSEEGIIASESANNATVGGALIPLISLGIPGSVIDAVLLGALVIHGLQPGPLLFEQNPGAVNTIIIAMFGANIVMFVFMLASVGWLAKLSTVRRDYLLPIILVFCVVGSYALANRMFDVWVMLGFGLVGLVMERVKLPLAPFVIGFVLAPVAEEHLSAGLMLSHGSFLPIFTRPVSLLFFCIAIGLAVWSILRHKITCSENESPGEAK
jgi:putative tricarboxylic transport membrane protein